MPSWVKDFLTGGPIFALAQSLWSWFMALTRGFLGMGVNQYSQGTWNYISGTLYPWFLSMGSVLVNIFFLVGFCRQATNLKENVTAEMWIELFIKVVIANVLMQNGLTIMQEFTGLAGKMSGEVLPANLPGILGNNYSIGLSLALVLLAPIYLILVIVCGVTILLEVMGRFLNLYMLMAVAPLALSTYAGGHGLENTAIAWFKSFLTNTFQVVAIALILRVSQSMIVSNVLTMALNNWGSISGWFAGAGELFWSMIYMPFMAISVKASDNFLKRTFDLR